MANSSIALTADQVNAINQIARDANLSAGDKRDIAARAGVSVRTVQRWFTGAAQTRNLLPSSVVGVVPKDAETVLGRATAIRLAVGEILQGSIEQTSQLHGAAHVRKSTSKNIGNLAAKVLDVRQGKNSTSYYWLGAAYEAMEFVRLNDGSYEVDEHYRIFDYEEGYQDLYAEELSNQDDNAPVSEAGEVGDYS